ncbi:hypothetical protein KUTeg_018723 [Tegillarca granosa]|uniref:Flavin-containing monooxygenase n=1 Tax=Tegillarca granosa TaxID=220873 RepID=A0ABQ9EF38_TEGGR|nr:hypothetical protein KUTeg_018723 [Tegillarca granosa]
MQSVSDSGSYTLVYKSRGCPRSAGNMLLICKTQSRKTESAMIDYSEPLKNSRLFGDLNIQNIKMSTVRRVAVIGAGASGLTAIKCCLDEDLEPVCFERADYISGLWHYTDEVEEGQACVMKSTVINTSKEMMSYSDFPIPKEYPFYMHNKYVDNYFHLYADKFGLKKYIRFQTEVKQISQDEDFKNSGKWKLTIMDKKTNTIEDVVFDACNGLSDFQGKVVHTHDFKTPTGYEGKRVVVIGIGNSGGDVSYLFASGSIIVKPDIKQFTTSGVEFTDGTFVDDIDAVILGTGYIFGFPFLDKSVIDVQQNKVDMYMLMFPPNLERHTLAIIGCFQPLGAIMLLSEMQSRLATRVFKGDVALPSRDEMWAEIHHRRNEMAERYVESQRHTIQVDYVTYIIELAEMVGCNPNLRQKLLTDPKLALKCIFGPCTPYQFRLTGPGKWNGAREAIMTQWDRTFYPLKTRPLGFKAEKSSNTFYLYVFFIVVLAWFIKNILFFTIKTN